MREAKKLSAVAIAKCTRPGRYAVGDGAYLQIAVGGSKAWVFRYQRDGKARHTSRLGSRCPVRPRNRLGLLCHPTASDFSDGVAGGPWVRSDGRGGPAV